MERIETAKQAIEVLEDVMYSSGNVEFTMRSYSGRGMYGKSCVGIVVSDLSEVFKLGQELSEYHFPTLKSDSMGLDMIVYWPYLHLTDEDKKRLDELEEY